MHAPGHDPTDTFTILATLMALIAHVEQMLPVFQVLASMVAIVAGIASVVYHVQRIRQGRKNNGSKE